MITAVNNFLLTLWLWSITWGIYQTAISAAIFFLFIKITVHYATSSSLFLSIGSSLWAFAILMLSTSITIFLFAHLNYIPQEQLFGVSSSQLLISITMSIFCTIMQALLFLYIQKKYKIHAYHLTLLALLSNITAALFLHQLLI